MGTPLTLVGVHTAQQGHEKLCADRWQELREEIKSLRRDISRLWKVVLCCAGALIVGEAWLLAEFLLRKL